MGLAGGQDSLCPADAQSVVQETDMHWDKLKVNVVGALITGS